MKICYRCKKLIVHDGVDVTVPVKPRTTERASKWRIITDGMLLAKGYRYHRRCLPPQWFKFAGSLPVGQSPRSGVPQ
jgi:hypothetical protein